MLICYFMAGKTNTENVQQNTSRFSMVAEHILTFAWSTNLVREGKIKSPNFKQIEWRCFQLPTVLLRIDKSVLSLNFKQFHQTLLSDSSCIVDITCYFI